jgi:hypothetical protein
MNSFRLLHWRPLRFLLLFVISSLEFFSFFPITFQLPIKRDESKYGEKFFGNEVKQSYSLNIVFITKENRGSNTLTKYWGGWFVVTLVIGYSWLYNIMLCCERNKSFKFLIILRFGKSTRVYENVNLTLNTTRQINNNVKH